MSKERDYMLKHCVEPLIGYTIRGTVVDDGDEFWGFSLEKDGEHKHVFVLADPEGNSPGFLEVNDG